MNMFNYYLETDLRRDERTGGRVKREIRSQ